MFPEFDKPKINNMKKLGSLTLFLGLFCAVSAQKTINDPNAEKRSVGSFHSISVSNGIDLYLSQGSESIAVSASETKFRDRIKAEVKDNVLKIWYEKDGDKWLGGGNMKLKAYVSFKTLEKLTASGGSDIDVIGTITVKNLSLNISGGSDFDGNMEGTDLDLNASGGSDVEITGKFSKVSIDASGGSDFDGYGLVTDYCKLKASGGSDVEITVNKELSANASGSSDVNYKGNAVVKDLRSTGSSSIKKSGR